MTTVPRAPLTDEQVVTALEQNSCNVAAAARDLGVTRQGLYDAMERFDLEIIVNKVVRRRATA
jgi:transcriptional regulator with GAF, ATPase, and Fis domain